MYQCERPRKKGRRANCENIVSGVASEQVMTPLGRELHELQKKTEILGSEAAYKHYHNRRRLSSKIYTQSSQVSSQPSEMISASKPLPTESSANEMDDRYSTVLRPMMVRESNHHKSRLQSEPVDGLRGRSANFSRNWLKGDPTIEPTITTSFKPLRRAINFRQPEFGVSQSLFAQPGFNQYSRQMSLPKAKLVTTAPINGFDRYFNPHSKPSTAGKSTRSNFFNSVPPNPPQQKNLSPIRMVSVSELNSQIDHRIRRLLKSFKDTIQ